MDGSSQATFEIYYRSIAIQSSLGLGFQGLGGHFSAFPPRFPPMSFSARSRCPRGARSIARSAPSPLPLVISPRCQPSRALPYASRGGSPAESNLSRGVARHAALPPYATSPSTTAPSIGSSSPSRPTLPVPFGMDLSSYPSMGGRVVLITGEGREGGSEVVHIERGGAY